MLSIFKPKNVFINYFCEIYKNLIEKHGGPEGDFRDTLSCDCKK